jgi:hypothetical protein
VSLQHSYKLSNFDQIARNAAGLPAAAKGRLQSLSPLCRFDLAAKEGGKEAVRFPLSFNAEASPRQHAFDDPVHHHELDVPSVQPVSALATRLRGWLSCGSRKLQLGLAQNDR